ncbi:MAG: peptidase [Legionellales bacterium RIFCSPHIGHO2_12_FULL_37_14]|nr:MAG: peptidase [Legionellales bacterium RIFCSPHIGHO2_12_FULL_37_14]
MLILPKTQRLYAFKNKALVAIYNVSTAKNGLGELKGSECTPRGWHQVHSVIGLDAPKNAVFVGRVWTKERYTKQLAKKFPARDWILSRIIWLDGLEEGFNKGKDVDTLARYIYIHGTKEPLLPNKPLSHGCIRMKNQDIIELADWVFEGMRVYIHSY